MSPHRGLTSEDFDHMVDSYFIQHEDELLGQDWLELYATEILDAKYQWTDVQDVVENQHHLTAHQKSNLLDILKRHQTHFDGTLSVLSWKCWRRVMSLDPPKRHVIRQHADMLRKCHKTCRQHEQCHGLPKATSEDICPNALALH